MVLKTGDINIQGDATIQTLTGLLKSAAGVLSALSYGASNTKLFMNAAGTAPEFASGVYIGSFTINLAAVPATTAVTGVGYKPGTVFFLACQDDSARLSIGFDLGTGATDSPSIYNNHEAGANSWRIDDGRSIFAKGGGTDNVRGNIQSMDSDGFTVVWATSGSMIGTLTIRYLALR